MKLLLTEDFNAFDVFRTECVNNIETKWLNKLSSNPIKWTLLSKHTLRKIMSDIVLLAREMLRDPYWPFHAAEALGVVKNIDFVPAQYGHWIA